MGEHSTLPTNEHTLTGDELGRLDVLTVDELIADEVLAADDWWDED